MALASGVVLSAAFYRSITMWSSNAWDLSSPTKILLIGAGAAVLGVIVLLVLARLGLQPIATGLTIGGLLMLLVHWQLVERASGLVLVALILVFAWLAQRAKASKLLNWLALTFVAAFGLAPILQLTVAHFQDSAPYPLVDLTPSQNAAATGLIEDVVLVIVDSYPNLQIAETWFGHESNVLIETLEERGFTVAPSAWSRHTYTTLSVSSILELKSVIEAGPTGPWGNRSSLFNILRGDNLVSQTLESADFLYTHIESGWDGTSCGPKVDRCIDSPWLDEQVWRLIEPTIALDWMEDHYFNVGGALNAADALEMELASLIANDSHDYVFAHFLLPHSPILVDETCHLRGDRNVGEVEISSVRAAFSDQMSCVDLLIMETMRVVDEDTAVLVTGDHGPGTGQQVGRHADEWSDADIAERFGVFLAYKLPPGCDSPSLPDPIVAMSSLLSCAVDGVFEAPAPEYLIGAQDPELVDPERMARIQALVESGLLPPEEG